MSDQTPDGDAPKKGYALDLSSNAARGTRPRRSTPKGFVPVVQKTINLSTPKADRPEPAEAPRARAQPSGARRGAQNPRSGSPNGAPRGGRKRDAPQDAGRGSSGGTSLADLLDEATLARLRGG